jgi:hypothetical protein
VISRPDARPKADVTYPGGAPHQAYPRPGGCLRRRRPPQRLRGAHLPGP